MKTIGFHVILLFLYIQTNSDFISVITILFH